MISTISLFLVFGSKLFLYIPVCLIPVNRRGSLHGFFCIFSRVTYGGFVFLSVTQLAQFSDGENIKMNLPHRAGPWRLQIPTTSRLLLAELVALPNFTTFSFRSLHVDVIIQPSVQHLVLELKSYFNPPVKVRQQILFPSLKKSVKFAK